ncbi:hypothetical protein Fmac_011391 [Flemingia macrophylla]|uniref:Uncharacterized protein n=1 Tax=Flemingia macrophylla TaxID=520843 RepID=A0ABD1MMA7_9FABA
MDGWNYVLEYRIVLTITIMEKCKGQKGQSQIKVMGRLNLYEYIRIEKWCISKPFRNGWLGPGSNFLIPVKTFD